MILQPTPYQVCGIQQKALKITSHLQEKNQRFIRGLGSKFFIFCFLHKTRLPYMCIATNEKQFLSPLPIFKQSLVDKKSAPIKFSLTGAEKIYRGIRSYEKNLKLGSCGGAVIENVITPKKQMRRAIFSINFSLRLTFGSRFCSQIFLKKSFGYVVSGESIILELVCPNRFRTIFLSEKNSLGKQY